MFDLSGTRARAIKVLRSWAEAEPLVRNVILFGSYVTGEATSTSDLGVAVGLNAPSYNEEAELFARHKFDWKAVLRGRLGSGSPPIELVSYDVNAAGENETGFNSPGPGCADTGRGGGYTRAHEWSPRKSWSRISGRD